MEPLLQASQLAQGVSCNSKTIETGDIFVAIRGNSTDGNQYALEAEKKGACAIVTDCPKKLSPVNIPVYCVSDARLALPKIAASCYDFPSKKLSLVGITGSNGKTTVSYMLEKIYQEACYKTGLIGTIKIDINQKKAIPSVLTTPDAASIQCYLKKMLEHSVTHVAMEVSAQGMEMHRTDCLDFTCGIMTNICPDHLDFHGTFDNYLKAKELFLNLIAPDKPLLFNKNNPYCEWFYNKRNGAKLYAAVNQSADISAYIKELTPKGSSFLLVIHNPKFLNHELTLQISLPLPGIHNVENALHAAAAALLTGVKPHTIQTALENFTPVERRLEIFEQKGVTVVDDTALNPGSLDAVFQTIASFPYHKLVVINAIRGKRGAAINVANADTLARHMPDFLFVTASSECTQKQDQVTELEKAAFLHTLNKHKINFDYHDTLESAIHCAWDKIHTGDLLVLLGAQGMDKGRSLLLQQTSRPTYHANCFFSPERTL